MSILQQLQKQKEEVQSSFKKSAPVASAEGLINGVLVPVEVPHDGGKLRIYLSVSAEALSSPQVFNAVLDEIAENFDLATWQPQGGQQSGFKKSWRKF